MHMVKNKQLDYIANYNVKYLIGRGSFGNVYRAESINTSQEVAIKFIEKKNLKGQPGLLSRVLQEVAIHSRLKHPSILELYSYFEDDLYIYLVLEMCQHGDLNSKLKNSFNFFTEDRVRRFMRQVVDGLLYLQKHRILHRDLTLSNLLLDKDYNIKIADFGLATQLDEPDEKHFTMCGTPNYISPEVASRAAHGLEVDVWSVGCMLFTMLVGSPPFDAKGVRKTLDRVIQAEFVIPDTISVQATSLIRCLLQKHPKDRIKLNQILDHPFIKGPFTLPPVNKMIYAGASIDSGRGDTISTVSNNQTNNKQHLYNMNNMNNNNKYQHMLCGNNNINMSNNMSHKFSCDEGVDCSTATTQSTTVQHLLLGHQHGSETNLNNNYLPDRNTMRNRSKPPLTLQTRNNNNKPRSRSYDQSSKQHKDLVLTTQQILKHNNNNVEILQTKFNNMSTTALNKLDNGVDNCLNIFAQSTPLNIQLHQQQQPMLPLQQTVSHHQQQTILQQQQQTILQQQQYNKQQPIEQQPMKEGLGPPLCAHRLVPIRQKTRNAVVSITSDGWICLEFTKCFAGEDYVTDVMFISADGQQIKYLLCKNGREMKLQNDEPVLNLTTSADVPCKHFTYVHLPSKYWKKYQYAVRFVNLVRSKTPKVTLYTRRAKCMLMENFPQPDFEVHFYDGTKFAQSSTTMKIIQSDGTMMVLDTFASFNHLLPETQDKWNYVIELYDKCSRLESLLTSFQSDLSSSTTPSSSSSSSPSQDTSYFPVTFGRSSPPPSNTRRPTNVDAPMNIPSTPSNINNCGGSSGDGNNADDYKNASNNEIVSPLSVRSYNSSNTTTSNATSTPNPLNYNHIINNTNTNNNTNNNSSNITNTTNHHNPHKTTNKSLRTFDCQKLPCIKHIMLPDIGHVYEYKNGCIVVERMDKTLIQVNSKTLEILLKPQSGGTLHFNKHDTIPPLYTNMLNQLPHIMNVLRQTRPIT